MTDFTGLAERINVMRWITPKRILRSVVAFYRSGPKVDKSCNN